MKFKWSYTLVFFVFLICVSHRVFSQVQDDYFLELRNGTQLKCHEISIKDNILSAISEDGSGIQISMNEVKRFYQLSDLKDKKPEQEILQGSKKIRQEDEKLNYHRKLSLTLKLAVIPPGLSGILNYDFGNFSVGLGGSTEMNLASDGDRNAYKSGFIELKYNTGWEKSRRAFFFGDIGYADYNEHNGFDQDHGIMLNGGFGIMLPFSQNVHFVADVGYKAIINNNNRYDSSFYKKHTTVTLGIQF